jgi:hypothetical protein
MHQGQAGGTKRRRKGKLIFDAAVKGVVEKIEVFDKGILFE